MSCKLQLCKLLKYTHTIEPAEPIVEVRQNKVTSWVDNIQGDGNNADHKRAAPGISAVPQEDLQAVLLPYCTSANDKLKMSAWLILLLLVLAPDLCVSTYSSSFPLPFYFCSAAGNNNVPFSKYFLSFQSK